MIASSGVFCFNQSPTFLCCARKLLSGFKLCGNWIRIARTIRKTMTLSGLNTLAFSKYLFISIIPSPAQKRERGMSGTAKRIVEGINVDKKQMEENQRG
jgi:hypothetical protein